MIIFEFLIKIAILIRRLLKKQKINFMVIINFLTWFIFFIF